MRRVAVAGVLWLGLCGWTIAAPALLDAHASLEVVQKWIYNYRLKPDPVHVPAAVRILIHFDAFEDKSSGIYLGFMAGALGADAAGPKTWLPGSCQCRAEDQWVLVRAIAFSGCPSGRRCWRNLPIECRPARS